jgi:DNA helicase-2/ATP-dependent DNA helicase PcrA
MTDLFHNLNPEQIKAVTHFGSPLLVIAGAGSGKTTVLTRKMAYLIQEMGVTADHILAITFTNKAAKEMKERVAHHLPGAEQPFVGTFHSFCAEVLRHDFHHLGRSRSFTICDQSDQLRLMRQLLKEFNLSEKVYTPSGVLYQIQNLKNQRISPVQAQAQNEKYRLDPKVAGLYAAYQSRLDANQLVDFNDMINHVVELFERFPNVLEKYQNRFSFILVDEYQDTNTTQYQLIHHLADRYKNLTVVGDFDQNIYSWRGANIQNILNFEKDYPNCDVILLEQNYRSTQTILNAANALIVNNQTRREKKLWTTNVEGDKIQLYSSPDEHTEARRITQSIAEFYPKTPYSEMVVLYRTNAQSRMIEEAFMASGIPYRVVGGLKFFSRAEIKDIIAYLKLIHNPNDQLAFARIINCPPRGVGDTSIGKILETTASTQRTIRDLTDSHAIPVTSRCQNTLHEFFRILDALKHHYDTTQTDKISSLIEAILDKTGYGTFIAADPKAQDRIENIKELETVAREEETDLSTFLTKIGLISELDDTAEVPNAVTLMTMHNAKGLEFDVVFIPGLEEGLLPHYKSALEPAGLEEERRLCYVALTRAKKRLILLTAKRRLIFGEVWNNAPSRFLDELPKDLIHAPPPTFTGSSSYYSSPSAGKPFTFGGSSSSQGKTTAIVVSPGETVIHAQWGAGVVEKVEGEGDNTALVVTFAIGTKKLLAKYAPIQKG